ncbi:MAG TPA: hypothetical protein VK671_01600 [Mucilaginibacter sp.]|jgi:hypothetical protein|nr:hypothetical protein [Mucilaginibacter sp.]
METGILFAISILMSLIVWNKISKKYLWLQIKDLELKKAVQPILFLNSFRFAGLSFLIPGVVNAGLNPAWALPAAFGDFTAAILALITLSLINSKLFRPLLWIFNILGFIDLLLAFVDGPRYSILPSLGAGYYIVILYVPILLLAHLMVFKLLLKNKNSKLSAQLR